MGFLKRGAELFVSFGEFEMRRLRSTVFRLLCSGTLLIRALSEIILVGVHPYLRKRYSRSRGNQRAVTKI
jgi:hypothetical protein